jgi:electron transfer flavoprotein beta subunit
MSINIIVCIKSVVLGAPDGKIVRLPDNCALNPFDRPALEMAFKLRGEKGGTITALSMGPEGAGIALYEAMAMGVDRAVLITDPALAGSDTLATSTALGTAIEKLKPFDLVLFGSRSSDSDTGQVGPQTAVRLNLPLVTGVYRLEYGNRSVVVNRRVDEFVEEYEIPLPGIITVHASAEQAGHIPLLGIEKAFGKGDFERMSMADLGLSYDEVGDKGSPTRVVSMSRIKKKRKCEFITGSVEEQVDELVTRLKEEGQIG